MFINVPITLRNRETGVIQDLLVSVCVEHIVSVFPQDDPDICSVMMITGDRLHVSESFNQFTNRLLDA